MRASYVEVALLRMVSCHHVYFLCILTPFHQFTTTKRITLTLHLLKQNEKVHHRFVCLNVHILFKTTLKHLILRNWKQHNPHNYFLLSLYCTSMFNNITCSPLLCFRSQRSRHWPIRDVCGWRESQFKCSLYVLYCCCCH